MPEPNVPLSTTPLVNQAMLSRTRSSPSNVSLVKTPGPGQFDSPPVSTSTAVKRVSASCVQPVADSPVPCGDSFFEDVNAFTQSHMSYMRGFKTPASSTNTSPSAQNAPNFTRDKNSASPNLVDRNFEDKDNFDNLMQDDNLFQNDLLFDEESISYGDRNSNSIGLPQTSEDDPIVLSQEVSQSNDGDGASVFKKPSVTSVKGMSYCDFDDEIFYSFDEDFDNDYAEFAKPLDIEDETQPEENVIGKI